MVHWTQQGWLEQGTLQGREITMSKLSRLTRLAVALVLMTAGLVASGVSAPIAGAAAGDVLWTDVARPAGSYPVRVVEDSAVDSAGNVYVTGRIGDRGASPNLDVLVAKYSPTGVPLWSTRYGTTGDDAGHGIAVTPDGSTVAVAADFYGIYAGGVPGDATFARARINANGQLQTGWTVATFDGLTGNGNWLEAWDNATVDGYAQDITLAADGSVFVSGRGGNPWTTLTVPPPPGCNPRFDPGCVPTTVPYFPPVPECAVCVGVLTAHLSAAGDPLSVHIIKPSLPAVGVLYGGMTGAGSDLWLSGQCNCSNPANGTMPDSVERAPVWVAQYSMAAMADPNAVAHPTWVRQYGSWVGFQGDEPTDIAGRMAADAAGNVYVGGQRTGAYVRSYGPTGTLRWDNRFGDAAVSDVTADVALDNWVNVFATGQTRGTIAGAPEGNQGGTDAFLAQLRTADGTLGWQHMYGTALEDGGLAVSASGRRVTLGGFAEANERGGLPLGISGLVRAYENDLVAPTISLTSPPIAPATYELGSTVDASWSCVDPGASASPPTGSGLAAPCSATTASGAPISTALPLGTKNYSVGPATDVVGNTTAAVSTTYTVVDTTAPAVTLSSPVTGSTYRVGDPPPVATFGCTDLDLVANAFPDAPLDGCVGQVIDNATSASTAIPNGASLSTATVGSFTVRVTGTDHSGHATVRTASYSVTPAGPTLSVGSASEAEGDPVGLGTQKTRTAQIPVVLSEPATVPVTVHYAIGSATGAAHPAAVVTDFKTKSGTLTFTPNLTTGKTQTIKYIAVSILPDAATEENEVFRATLSAASGATVAGDGTADSTILDDDAPAAGFTVSAGDTVIDEANVGVTATAANSAKITVSLNRPATGIVQVTVAVGGGSATVGTDYKLVTTKTITFAAGQWQRVVAIPILPDRTVEVNETVLVTLSSASGATVARPVGTVTIRNDD